MALAGCRTSWKAGCAKPGPLIVYTPEYFRKERNIEVRTGARVVSISHPRREVTLESGARACATTTW